MDTKQIAELRELLGKATPGTWEVNGEPGVAVYPECTRVAGCEPDNARLIAAMRNALGPLLDELERLRAAARWQPMDTVPRDGTEVLLKIGLPPENHRTVLTARMQGRMWVERRLDCDHSHYESTFDAWTPLPTQEAP